jgi:hypothetical protein
MAETYRDKLYPLADRMMRTGLKIVDQCESLRGLW